MKRSIMIDSLSWYLSQISNYEIGTQQDAENLLDFIESFGMIPPLEPNRTVEDCDLGLPEWEDEENG